MKNLKVIIVGVICTLVVASFALAASNVNQTVQMSVSAMCVVAVTGNPSTLTISAPATGGQTPSNASSSTTYVQYTSTVASATNRKITAKFDTGNSAPAGCSLKLTVTPSGGTNEGSTAGQITLTTTAQDAVTTIKSCATGTGANNGSQLGYVLEVTDMTALVAGESKSATVTLTLTDAS